MTGTRQESQFEQRLHRQRVSLFWWLSKRTYLTFVVRELTSVAVAWFVVYLLLLVRALGTGPDAYQSFLDWSAKPWMVAVNVVAFVLAVYHTVTWFAVTPQAMVVKVRGYRVPGQAIGGGLYLAWIAVSAVLAWLVLVVAG
jgi:fumarate reductase subunit C